MLQAAGLVLGAALLMLYFKSVLGDEALGYLVLPTTGALFFHALARQAKRVGPRRTLLLLIVANPFAWLAGYGLVVGVYGLARPDAMGLGAAIGLYALFLVLVFLLWLAGAGLVLSRPRYAWLYGLYSGLVLAALPPVFGVSSPWALVLGIGFMAFGLTEIRAGARLK